jgi:hypothetical protein
MRLTSHFMGHDRSVTIPAHKQLKIGTLAAILGGVANYLEITREDLARNLFDR